MLEKGGSHGSLRTLPALSLRGSWPSAEQEQAQEAGPPAVCGPARGIQVLTIWSEPSRWSMWCCTHGCLGLGLASPARELWAETVYAVTAVCALVDPA